MENITVIRELGLARPDIFLEVLPFLDLNSLKAIRLVSKEVNELSESHFLKRAVLTINDENIKQYFEILGPNHLNFQRVAISSNRSRLILFDNALKFVCSLFADSLRELKLKDHSMSIDNVQHISRLKSLKSIDWNNYNTNRLYTSYVIMKLAHVENITLVGPRILGEFNFDLNEIKTVKLKRLEVSRSEWKFDMIYDPQFYDVLERIAPNLEHLNLRLSHTFKNLEFLANLEWSNLTSLKIVAPLSAPHNLFNKMRSLTKLTTNAYNIWTPSQFRRICISCPNIEELSEDSCIEYNSFSGGKLFNGEFVQNLMKLKNLRELKLINSDIELSTNDASKFQYLNKRLRSLALSGKSIGTLTPLLELTQLTELTLNIAMETEELLDEFLSGICSKMLNLENININVGFLIFQRRQKPIQSRYDVSCLKKLRNVSIHYNGGDFSQPYFGIDKLFGLPELQSLTLIQYPNIQCMDIIELPKRCNQLKFLEFQSCYIKISPNILDQLRIALPDHEFLIISELIRRTTLVNTGISLFVKFKNFIYELLSQCVACTRYQ